LQLKSKDLLNDPVRLQYNSIGLLKVYLQVTT